jgi:preprotein translocase subunit SecD
MNSAFLRFNFYLLAVFAVIFAAGCAGGIMHPKPISTLDIYLECLPDGTDRSHSVPILRQEPVMVNVEKDPFLTAANISEARVVTSGDTFQLSLHFNQRGTWLLEQYSARYPQKRFAIFGQWGEKLKEGRWLAAPKIQHRISDGILVFTPDATREEAEQIALGINNLEHELSK